MIYSVKAYIMDFFIYAYLDIRKPGQYNYDNVTFDYEPIYIGKGKDDRHLAHIRKAKALLSRGETSNRLFIRKLCSMLTKGFVPTIVKVGECMDEQSAFLMETKLIKSIGRYADETGTLLNIAEGGSGGITWVGENPFKGKSLEELHGLEVAHQMKSRLSETAKLRVGEANPNYGNTGEKNPLFGKKTRPRTAEEKDRLSKLTKAYLDSLSKKEYDLIYQKAIDAKAAIPDEVKQEWYRKISEAGKGREFTDEHRQKLSETNYRLRDKGKESNRLSEETKQKLSDSLKGREFSLEHRAKLTKCIRYEEWKAVVAQLLTDGLVTTITSYRVYARQNPDLKLPRKPEKSYVNEGWEGFVGLFR